MVIKQEDSVMIVVCLARSDSGEVPGRKCIHRLGLSHTSPRAFPFPRHIVTYLNLVIHSRKAGPSFHGAQNTLCLCMKACLAHSVLSKTAKAGIEQRAGRQSVPTFLEGFQRL